MQKTLRPFAAALAFLAALLLILAMLFTSLQLVMHDEDYFYNRYEAYGTADMIGISTEDITRALMQLVYYMEGDVPSIDLTVTEDGQEVSMYNDRERLHMVDVQVLYQSFRTLRNFAVPAAAVLLIAAGAMLEKGSRLRIFAKAYLFGLHAYALVIGALGVWVAVDFTGFWIKFHHVFFTNDLWILSYATDRMIRICPEQLFNDIVVRFALQFIAAAAALGIGAGFAARKKKAANA